MISSKNITTNLLALRVNEERLRLDFAALSAIGATGEGGVHRPTFSEAHLAARDWLHQRVIEAGLEFRSDGAGNCSACLPCGPAHAPTLLLGSHLDSVPQGGRFDGALGVLAGLEVLRVVKEAGLSLPIHLEAIDFTDEEGTLVGHLGSLALAGRLTAEELQQPRGGRVALETGLVHAGLTEAGLFSARRPAGSLAGYLELHIEQGPRLENSGTNIGIVTSIAGKYSYRLTFIGRADHAGTTPLGDRLDASWGASTFILAVREIMLNQFPECVANVGKITIEPAAFNIVPARAVLALEFRAPTLDELNRLQAALLAAAHQTKAQFGLGLNVEFLSLHLPSPMHQMAQQACQAAAEGLGLTSMTLASGAGHDAQSMVDLCPTGMIFIPSLSGISHAPQELTHWQDCVNGANLLLQAALGLALA